MQNRKEVTEGNALEPGTVLPIHRHTQTNEVVVILRGSATQYFYDEQGNVDEVVTIKAGSDCTGMSVERGRWHRIESLESGTVIFCFEGRRGTICTPPSGVLERLGGVHWDQLSPETSGKKMHKNAGGMQNCGRESLLCREKVVILQRQVEIFVKTFYL